MPSNTSLPLLDVVRLPGLTEYDHAWALQRALHDEIARRERADTLLLLEHPHTLTMGRRGGWKNLRTSPERLDALGFQRWQADRGGDITYHGPGQLVGYPIVNIQRAEVAIGDFMRAMEQAHIDLLAAHGVDAGRLEKYPGVWCGQNKITAVGVRVTRWTTLHGFALNINTDVEAFGHILPCGLEGKGVTTLARELGVERADFAATACALAERFAQGFGRRVRWRDPEALPTPPAEDIEEIRAQCLVRAPNQGDPS